MKILIKQLMMYTLMVFILLSCSKPSTTSTGELENQFATVVPLTDINKSLQIAVDGQETSFASGSEIKLVVYNKSTNFLYIDSDPIKLLSSLDNLHWVEVKNSITYSATMKLSPMGTILLDTRHTSVQPILDQSNIDAKKAEFPLRIVIMGEIMDGETRTGKKVAAYIDVTLKP